MNENITRSDSLSSVSTAATLSDYNISESDTNYTISDSGKTYTFSAAEARKGNSGDSVFSKGLSVLDNYMQLLTELANSKFETMNQSSERARLAQSHLSTVDSKIAELTAKGDNKATGSLDNTVAEYIKDNQLVISGVCGFNSDGKWEWESGTSSLRQDQFNAIKGSLENVANRASDFVSSSQLQLQKLMQTYNVCVSLINSMQTMLADMNKTIAQGIR